MSLELVLLVPVLVLLTVFVLWAGRGGQVALTADLAAEEAATAAALCCEEDSGGASGREALVEDVLEARPGLGFLCIGGPRPDAGVGSDEFLSEHWLKFEPGRDTGGVGVLGVQFLCETDGAVAPLRGLFPTVTFHGQASEVVLREPRFIVGFDPTRVKVEEGTDPELVFTVVVEPAFGEKVTLTYEVVDSDTTAAPEDFEGTDFAALLGLDSLGRGTVMIDANADSAEIRLPVFDDDFFEGDEQLVLTLTGALPPEVQLDDDRTSATGVIEDNDPRPYLQIMGAPQVTEGGILSFEVRVGNDSGAVVADIAQSFTVGVSTLDDPGDACCTWATAMQDYTPVTPADVTLSFSPGGPLSLPVQVATLDDESSPVGEPTEYVRLVLSVASPLGALELHGVRWKADGKILDDEATVSISDITPQDAAEGDLVVFMVDLDKEPAADVTLNYTFAADDRAGAHQATQAVGNSCTAGDYLGATGTVTVAAFSQQATFEVQTCEDLLVERDETFWVELSRATNGGEVVVPSPTGDWGTIRNDDVPVVSIVADPADASGVEGQAERLKFTVSLTVGGRPAQLSEDITVDYAIGDFGTEPATAPGPPDADYTVTLGTPNPQDLSGSTLQGTLTFTAGTSGTLPVTEHLFEAVLRADHLLEGDEKFQLDLDNLMDPVGAAVFEDTDGDPDTDDSYAVGTITDDPPPVLSVTGFTGPEGTTPSFVVSVAAARAGEVTVDYSIAGAGARSATDPAAGVTLHDYTAATGSLSGTLTFPYPDNERSVGVRLRRDAIHESDETLRLTLQTPTGAVLFDRDLVTAGVQAYGVGTITDVDPPWLIVDNVAQDEGLTLEFTVTVCNRRARETVTVDYETANRNAEAGRDYVAVSGTLTFSDSSPPAIPDPEAVCGSGAVAAQSHSVGVRIRADAVAEVAETFHLVLSENPNPSLPLNAALADDIGVGTINDVNAPSVVVRDPGPAVEGEDLAFIIAVEDSETGGEPTINTPVTVWYATADGTAAAGTDYIGRPSTRITFSSGSETHRVVVRTLTDREDEDDETFALVLSDVSSHAGIGDAEGTGTIIDQDPPVIRVSNASEPEGETLEFFVTLDRWSDRPVTVFYETEDGTAAAASGDYTAVSRTELTIAPGATSLPVVVSSLADDEYEVDETFRLVLSDPSSNARLGRAVGIGTIETVCVDMDDGDQRPPALTFATGAPTGGLDEWGVAPEGEIARVGVRLEAPLCDDSWVQFCSLVAGGDTATGDDFEIRACGRLAGSGIYAGHLDRGSQFFTVEDDLDEDDETFTVGVTWYAGAAMPLHYLGLDLVLTTVTILDDDPLPNLRVAEGSAREGHSATFEVTLDAPSGRTVTVQYRTVDASAVGGVDYEAWPWTTIEFVPDPVLGGRTPTSATIAVQTYSDADDVDDTFWVELGSPSNAAIADSLALGTVIEGAGPSLSVLDTSAGEGSALTFAVGLSDAATSEVTVRYTTVARPPGVGAATPVDDYVPTLPGGVELRFGVGVTERTFSVLSVGDDEPEGDETFLVELSDARGASLADPIAEGRIIDDEGPCAAPSLGGDLPQLGVLAASALEASEYMRFTITLDEPLCAGESAQMCIRNVGETAWAFVDYAHFEQCRTIFSGESVRDYTVNVFDDDLHEADETFVLSARWGWDTTVPVTARGTIFDDDAVPTLEASDASTGEGGFLSFVLELSAPSGRETTVEYATGGGTAAADADYRPIQGAAGIPRGELSTTVRVRSLEDLLDEDDETVELRLANPSGASFAPGGDVGVGTIDDDDDPPAVGVSNPSADEDQVLVFAVTLDTPSGRAGSVAYRTRDGPANGGATAGADYGSESGRLDFAAGETVKTVSVQSLSDDETEGDERFFLDLGSSDFGLDKDIGTGIIRDVTQRRVSVSDAAVGEGGVLGFVVGFGGPPASGDITVAYSTVAVTAEAGRDYSGAVESAPGVVRILAGRTSVVVPIETVHDTLDEDHEQLKLVLSDPVGAVLADSEAVGTIIDDDPEPLLSVDDPEAAENGDGTPVTFTLRLSEVSGRAVKVRYATVDGTAKKGDDYVEVADGEVTIAADYQTALVEVALVDDDVEEGVERFLLELSGPSNARFGDSAGAATILDDDAPPQILIDDAAATYEAAGASVSFPVRLSRADPDAAVTVDYATEDATATAGNDYTAPTDTLTTNTLTIPAGQTATMVMVDLLDDDVDEDTETFRLRLSNPSANATLGNDSAVATILDDDGLAKLSVSDAPEATEGATATFSVELNRSSARAVTVAYAAVVDPLGGDAAAIPGQDFEAVTGTLTIAARSTSATVGVPLADDALDEHTETFWMRLSNPTGADVEDGTGIGTIADDDPLPQLSVGDSGATEGDPIRFTVTLDSASGRTVTVPWTTAAGSTGNPASPTGDYVAASGILTFASGTTTAHIDITTVHDEVSEPDETFQIRLGQPTNATVDDGVAVGAIVDDDSLPRLSIAGTELLETDSPATFVVTLSHTSSQSVTVDYATTAVTATAGDDYGTPGGEATGTLVIPAGLDTGEISVYVADDDLSEGTETFTITLTDPVNAVIAEGAGTATGTIRDADGPPRASIAAATATEGDATIEFPVTLSHAAASDVTVRYSTFDGTATQPGDYTATTATLTIPASSTTATIAVALTDDGFVEDPESFLLRLHDPTGLEIATAEAVGVIIDDDDLPWLSIQRGVRVNEDVGSVTLRVMLSRPSDVEVTVEYYVTARTPLMCPAAVAVVPGALVFAPGAVVRTFEVQIVNDTSLCSNGGIRGARVYLRNPRNAEIDYRATNAGIGVFDLQVQPCVVLGGVTVVGEDVGVAVLSVGLQRSHTENVTITLDTIAATPQSWTVFTGSATAGDDYVALSSHTVDVPAGTLLVPVEVTIVDDTDPEEAEGFGVRVSSAAGADAACGGFYLWRAIAILDDDSTREVSVADVSVQESGTAIFVVSLDVAATSDITVDYTTVDGTAAQPGDYTETAGTVRIPAGAPSALVEVPLVDDTDTEPDETFTLRLTGAVGASIADDEATATINDNDGSLPVVRLARDESIYQGLNTNALIVRTVLNDGDVARVLESGHGDFFAFLDDPATTPVTFSINLLEVPSLGELAASRTEFAIGGNITNLSIMDGDTEAWVSVSITQDNIPELDERFLMVLNDAVDARLEIGHVWVEIIDDDVPIVTVADVVADESAGNVVFNVQLHAAAVHPASLRYTTRAIRTAGDGAASPGEDYSTASGTLNIPAGATSATISVPIIGDSVDEPAETFLLVLSDPELLAMGDSVAVGTITDDDPGFWIDDRRVWENVGTMTFTVVRDHTSTGAVAVGYRFAAGGSAVGGTACTGGVDFVWPSGSASGTVTMPAAGTEAAISVEVCNDDDPEGREILLVELTGVTGRRTTAVGTIVDDDRTDLPRINIYNSDVRTEGLHVARGGASFQIYADGPLTGTVTVAWRTENCLATDTNCPHPAAAGDDYIANSGTVTLTPTDISATVTVTVRDDTTGEDSEEFFVRITGVTGPAAVGSGVTHTDPVGIGFIVDDD